MNLPTSTPYRILLFAVLCLLLPAPVVARAQQQPSTMNLPAGFIQETVSDELDGPTSFAFAPDGRIFVTQKAGAVKVIHNGQLQSENFIDLSHEVNQMGDRGLLNVAVHPQFPAAPYVYFAYVYEPPEAHGYTDRGARVGRVLRIEADPNNPNRHVPDTGVVLVGRNSTFEQIGNPERPDQPPFTCVDENGAPVRDCLPAEGTAHTVDMIRFGRDGALYISVGDGSVNGAINMRAQDVDSLAGKILRVDPNTGQGYAGNPFYDGDPNSNRSKVYALGLRNPFRFALHPVTGALYVGEVGNDAWEEISRGGAGANFGWPCYEGPDPASNHERCQPLFDGAVPLAETLHAYRHERGLGAAIGGDFYTGSSYPAYYRNAYFFADFNAGLIQFITERSGEPVVNNFASNVLGPVQISMGPDGNLYVLSIVLGSLFRIRYVSADTGSGDNTPPTAVAAATPMEGAPPLEVTFSSNGSSDPDGDALTFAWNFGNGERSTEANPTHTYSEPGRYTATLTVTDSRGEVRASSVEIAVGGEPPVATILAPTADARYRIGDAIAFSGAATDAEDGTLSGASLQWDAVLHHNEHVHYDFFQGEGATSRFNYADHGDNTYLELCLTATDSSGLQDTDCIDLRLREVTYTFDSVPSGLPVLYAGSPYVTPFSVTTPVSATRRIGAARAPADGLTFAAWSDGGAATHEITIGATDQTLIARYNGTVDSQTLAAVVAEQGAAEFTAPAAATATDAGSDTPPAADIDAVARDVEQSEPAADDTGHILREWWMPLNGEFVADLVDHPDFPHNPTGSEFITSLEAPREFGKDYGARIRGYLHPPVTGEYRFWIASDDRGELLLSPDANPAHAVMIARAPDWTNSREWDKYPAQASAPIPLEAGQTYYIEVLHKEANFKDNLSVAWHIPERERSVIDGIYLSPFIRTEDRP